MRFAHTTARWLLVGALFALGAVPAAAGTSAAPEVTDIAGDANGINGQGRTTQAGQDTRPASVDSADLRAVWFETSWGKTKDIDPASGAVTRVRHVPLSLRVHVQTTAPIYPASVEGMRPLSYDVGAKLPGGCDIRMRLTVGGNQATDSAVLHTLTPVCAGGASTTGDSTKPTYAGNVATFSYPFAVERFGAVLQSGIALSGVSANVSRSVPFAGSVMIDETPASATTFTIGQDVPADIDCTTTPSPDCAP